MRWRAGGARGGEAEPPPPRCCVRTAARGSRRDGRLGRTCSRPTTFAHRPAAGAPPPSAGAASQRRGGRRIGGAVSGVAAAATAGAAAAVGAPPTPRRVQDGGARRDGRRGAASQPHRRVAGGGRGGARVGTGRRPPRRRRPTLPGVRDPAAAAAPRRGRRGRLAPPSRAGRRGAAPRAGRPGGVQRAATLPPRRAATLGPPPARGHPPPALPHARRQADSCATAGRRPRDAVLCHARAGRVPNGAARWRRAPLWWGGRRMAGANTGSVWVDRRIITTGQKRGGRPAAHGPKDYKSPSVFDRSSTGNVHRPAFSAL